MATPVKWGSEFLVNTTTASAQYEPTLAALSDGRFVAAWTDFSLSTGDTSGSAVFAQVFNADGSKSGAEFLVNTTTNSFQEQPTLTALTEGRFVAAWRDHSTSITNGTEVRAQLFNADGSKSGTEFLVNTISTNDQWMPTLTTLTDGRFVAAWTDQSQSIDDPSGYAVRAQIFNADGSKSGTEFLVNTNPINNQLAPTLAAVADGRFVAAWTTFSQSGGDTSGSAVHAQVFNADGSRSGTEFLVNSTMTSDSDQADPNITSLTDGRFVAAWSDLSQSVGDTSSFSVRAQVFNADGSKSGAELLVNTTTTGLQAVPTLTALSDGRFVAVWWDFSQTGGDTSYYAVRAQAFNADGSKSGIEFLVNTTTNDYQFQSTITALADGRFVAAWSDRSATGGDTDDYCLRAQIFDPREAEVTLYGSALADDFVGTAWNDVMSGNSGNDSLNGGDGADTLNGGNGADLLIGGKGNDTYYVNSLSDTVVEAAHQGADRVISSVISLDLANYAFVEMARLNGVANLNLAGNVGANQLVGNAGDNLVQGLGGNDKLFGNAGNDTLYGGSGSDTLQGGEGKDRLTGGLGADVFVFVSASEAGNGANRDRITDFALGVDKIDLSAIDAHELLAGNQAFSFIGNAAFSGVAGELRYNAGNGIVYADTNGDAVSDLQLQLIGKPAITAGDFIL